MTAADAYADESDMIKRMRQHRLKGLSEMAAGMAHEINQPLGGIRGFAEGILIGLEEGWDISTQEIIAKMRRIISEADRIDELIQGVRSFADDGGRLDLVAVDALTATQAAVRLMGTRLQAHGVEIAVSDNGIGMDDATLAQAGEPFFTTKGPDRGVGLGLATVRGVLAQCGGELALESVLAGGTTATVRLWQRSEERP